MKGKKGKTSRPALLGWALAIYGVLSLGSMATMGIGAAVLAAVVGGPGRREFAKEFSAAFRVPAYRNLAFASLALLFALALSLIVAEVAPLWVGGHVSEVHFAREMAKAWYLLWPLVLAPVFVAAGEPGRRLAVRAWLIAFAVFSAIGIIQHFTGWPRPQLIPGTIRYHATIFLGHHLSVASIFIFPFFAALDLDSRADLRERSGLSRRALMAIGLLGGLCLFFTYSRMLWVAFQVGFAVWVGWAFPKKWRHWVMAGVALCYLAIVISYPPILQRLHDGSGVTTRQELWEANVEFFKQRPLTGVGWHHNIELSGYYLMAKHPGEEVFSGHAHNTFLDVLGSTGLIGALAWLGWCVTTLMIAFTQARRGRGFARGLVCAWLVFYVNGLTQVNFWEAKVLHQMCWVVAWSVAWALLPQREKIGV